MWYEKVRWLGESEVINYIMEDVVIILILPPLHIHTHICPFFFEGGFLSSFSQGYRFSVYLPYISLWELSTAPYHQLLSLSPSPLWIPSIMSILARPSNSIYTSLPQAVTHNPDKAHEYNRQAITKTKISRPNPKTSRVFKENYTPHSIISKAPLSKQPTAHSLLYYKIWYV